MVMEETDPFVKRVVTVKPGDVVIFKYDGFLDKEMADELNDHVASRLGSIPFLIVNRDFDITVLKQSENKAPSAFIA